MMRFQYQIDDFNAPDWTDIEASCSLGAALAAAENYDVEDRYLASNEASIEVKIRAAADVGKDESAVEVMTWSVHGAIEPCYYARRKVD